METWAVVNGTVVTPEETWSPGALVVAAEAIAAVGALGETPIPTGAKRVDAAGHFVVPGLVDLHIHGLLGHDCMGPGLAKAIQRLPAYGVTAFLATTLTRPAAETQEALAAMVAVLATPPQGADCLGIHLEGPFLSSVRAGMATAAWFEPLTWERFEAYQRAADGRIRLLTFAPEAPEALASIPRLVACGVVPSVGHSDATYEQIVQAVQAGLCHATHTFNAMRPFHHREPGVTGAVLALDEITAQLIADGVHVHPAAMRVLLRAKGFRRVALVSDAAPLAGLPDGLYRWGEQEVIVAGGACRLADGTLAGAHALLDTGLRTLAQGLGLPLADALTSAATTPAAALGVRKGRLAPGYDADIVLLDGALRPVRTFVRGREVYRA